MVNAGAAISRPHLSRRAAGGGEAIPYEHGTHPLKQGDCFEGYAPSQ